MYVDLQTRLPTYNTTSIEIKSKENNEKEKQNVFTTPQNISQNKMVRTDSTEQKIDKFLNTSSSIASEPKSEEEITR